MQDGLAGLNRNSAFEQDQPTRPPQGASINRRSPTARSPVAAASRPSSAISPANSWPMTTGGLSRLLAELSHSQDMKVGAADAGMVHPDQDVIRAHTQGWHAAYFHARSSLLLHEGAQLHPRLG